MKRSEFYICKSCGFTSPKWLGKCPRCGEWNSFSQGEISPKTILKEPIPIDEVESSSGIHLPTGIGEFDRVLGGGIVVGSLVLIGGEPGIGKSTLALQVAGNMAKSGYRVLYFSGEESEDQISMRAKRIGALHRKLEVISEVDLDLLRGFMEKGGYSFVVVDSIQTIVSRDMDGLPGSISQVKKATEVLLDMGKRRGITTIIIGHITKEGYIAGPKALEHMVDVVIYFEGERDQTFRILRPVKNRFGSTKEIGVLEMTESGLVDVENPSLLFLSERPSDEPGSVVASTVAERRPLLVEIQALVTESHFGMPKRTFIGVDPQRVSLIISILEKKLSIPLGSFDVFVNVTGGLKIKETGVDLAIAVSIMSSYYEKPLPKDAVFFGELGLTGEVRRVSFSDERIGEAVRLGYGEIYMPMGNMAHVEGARLEGFSHLREVKRRFFR